MLTAFAEIESGEDNLCSRRIIKRSRKWRKSFPDIGHSFNSLARPHLPGALLSMRKLVLDIAASSRLSSYSKCNLV